MTLTPGPRPERSERVHHPVFARLYARLAASAEAAGAAEHRDELLSGLHGRVVEVGAGPGTNFSHYPPAVREIIAIEPEPTFRARARLAASTVPVKVVGASAAALPFANGSADAVVFSLVLCSVISPATALAEAARILGAGGELRFYEHVRSADRRVARFQDRVDRLWPYVTGGCHCNRDTETAIATAGFTLLWIRRFDFRTRRISLPVTPHVIGIAVAR
jgi:SAM-dependent methyltransferase